MKFFKKSSLKLGMIFMIASGNFFVGSFLVLSFFSGRLEAKEVAKVKKVFFISPKDSEVVTSPVKIKMGVEGYEVKKAGEAPDEKTSGHHHLLVDQNFIPAGQVIPSDEKHVHFGKGQVETELKLEPGEHKLTLQFADGAHRSYGEVLSKTIKVIVK